MPWKPMPGSSSTPMLARGVMLAAQVLEQGKESIKQIVERIGNPQAHVEVGFIAGMAPAEVIERAFYQEFGTETIPERSFIRWTMRRNQDKYRRLITQLSKRVADGRMTAKDALEWLGDEIAADMQARIQGNIAPRLKPETIRGKKRRLYARPNIALIATGEMFHALSRRFRSR